MNREPYIEASEVARLQECQTSAHDSVSAQIYSRFVRR